MNIANPLREAFGYGEGEGILDGMEFLWMERAGGLGDVYWSRHVSTLGVNSTKLLFPCQTTSTRSPCQNAHYCEPADMREALAITGQGTPHVTNMRQ